MENQGSDMRAEIMKCVDALEDYVSFANLKSRVDGFGGQLVLLYPGFDNLVIWPGVSREFIDGMNDLIASHDVFLESTAPLTYIIDGATLTLPLARSMRSYKTERWTPMVVRPWHKISTPIHG